MPLVTKKIHQFDTVVPIWEERSTANPIKDDPQGNTVISFMASGDRNEFVEIKMSRGEAMNLTAWLVARFGDSTKVRAAIKKAQYRDPTEIACP